MAHSPGSYPELAIEDCIGMAAKDNTPVQVILLEAWLPEGWE